MLLSLPPTLLQRPRGRANARQSRVCSASQLTTLSTDEVVKSWTWHSHRVSYEQRGSGPPVVLSHGALAFCHFWRFLLTHATNGFGSSAAHYRRFAVALAAQGFTVYS